MDFAGGLRRLGSALDGPGTDLLLAGGEKRHQPQQVVRGNDELVQTSALDAELLAELFGLLLGKAGQLGLDFAAERDNAAALALRNLLNLQQQRSGRADLFLVDVRDVQQRLGSEQERLARDLGFRRILRESSRGDVVF